MSLALAAFTKVAGQLVDWKVGNLPGPSTKPTPRARICGELNSAIASLRGKKIPLQRSRVRDTRKQEVAFVRYETLQRASLMEDSVWHKVMHGLTRRRYGEVGANWTRLMESRNRR